MDFKAQTREIIREKVTKGERSCESEGKEAPYWEATVDSKFQQHSKCVLCKRICVCNMRI